MAYRPRIDRTIDYIHKFPREVLFSMTEEAWNPDGNSSFTWKCKICGARFPFGFFTYYIEPYPISAYMLVRGRFSLHLVESHPEEMALAVLKHGQ